MIRNAIRGLLMPAMLLFSSCLPAAASSVFVAECGRRSVYKTTSTLGDLGFPPIKPLEGEFFNFNNPKIGEVLGLPPPAPISREDVEAVYAEGSGYYDKSDFDGAALAYGRGISMARKFGDRTLEAQFRNAYAETRAAQGQDGEALRNYEEVCRAARESGDHAALARGRYGAGLIRVKIGDYARALESFLDGSRVVRDNNWLEAGLLRGAAAARFGLGDASAALQDAQRALELLRKFDIYQDDEALLRLDMAKYHAALGDFQAAWNEAEEASLIRRKQYKEDRLERQTKSLIAIEMGRPDLAASLLKNAKEPFYEARASLAAGDAKGAEALFLKLLAQDRKQRVAPSMPGNLLGLGLSLERQGRCGQARPVFNEAILLLERKRDKLPPAARWNFFTGKEDVFSRLEAYKGRSRCSADAADGFYWSESAKARMFGEALSRKSAGKAGAIPEDLAMEESSFDDEISRALQDEDAALQETWEEAARNVYCQRQYHAAFIAKLRAAHPAYAAAKYPQPYKARQIALAPGEAVLEYDVGEPQSRLYLLTADKKVAALTIRATAAELAGLVGAFRKPFEAPLDAAGRFVGGFDAASGLRLYELLLKPALSRLPKNTKLIIVPDGPLGLISFEALPVSSAPLRYAADALDIGYAQSATALSLARALRKDAAAAAGLLVLADPIFSRDDPRVRGAGLEGFLSSQEALQVQRAVAQRLMGVGGARREEVSFPRLEETGRLADRLYSVFGRAAVRLVGQDARLAALRQEELSRYRYLVFATHGLLANDIPYIHEPALVLSQLGNAAGEDGFLTLSQVMGLRLNADVAALTACKTGLGRQIGGEGVMGLGRGFQFAGARNVLMSLWSVAEQSTTRMTESFFRNLREGRGPREALRRARAEIRGAGYEHPFFWAPFILMVQ